MWYDNLSNPRSHLPTRAAASLLAALALLLQPQAATAQTVLPTDVKATCTVAPADFNGWFKTGTPAKDGIVNPADGLSFAPDTLCSFYKWSAQMFLWLTSPLGPTTHVFASSDFFGVAPPDANGRRQFLPQDNNKLLSFAP